MVKLPAGSIYLWMYSQGLKWTPIEEIEAACAAAGVTIRKKDYDNYVRGLLKSDKYTGVKPEYDRPFDSGKNFFNQKLSEYPVNPTMDIGERTDCWVPCRYGSPPKPLIKWSLGAMRWEDAKAYYGYETMAQNLRDLHIIVIDCDGDHDNEHLDFETIAFLSKYQEFTHTLWKPKTIKEYVSDYPEGMGDMPASFHLTFWTDRSIPTMHFPAAHIDVLGNRRNQLRYLKNKKWNGVSPLQLTEDIWKDIQRYIERRESAKNIYVGSVN